MRYATVAPPVGASDPPLASGGERRLMLAVLEDALRTLLGARLGRTNPASMRRELAWLMSPDRSHPFTFERVCDALGIDAHWLRRRTLDAFWSSGVRAVLRAGMETNETVAGQAWGR